MVSSLLTAPAAQRLIFHDAPQILSWDYHEQVITFLGGVVRIEWCASSVFFMCDKLSLRGLVVQIQYLMQSLTLGAVIKQISYLTPDLGPTTII